MAVLASMLHELDRDGDAAEVFEKLMHRYDNEKMFQMQIDVFPFEIPSNYHLYLANHLAKENKVQEARKHYFDSIQLSPSNVDALIGLSKLPEDASEKRLRMEAQSQIVNDMRKEIASRDRDLRIAGQRIVLFEKQRLANELNSLAWLITNTEGDQKEALLMSRKACKLAPDRSAYWDTLAHAYEKNGYFESAYRSQLKAIELEPNQPSLIRALKRFREKAQSETQPTP